MNTQNQQPKLVKDEEDHGSKVGEELDLSDSHGSTTATAAAAVVVTTEVVSSSSSSSSNQTPSDLIVFLDIDQTMIYSKRFSNEADADAYVDSMPKHPVTGKTVEYARFDCGLGGTFFHMNLRPGLKEFLEKLSTTFEVHIFTAALKSYAHSVASILDPDSTIFSEDRIWCREHCQEIGETFVKDLSTLPPLRDRTEGLKRAVLVDDRVNNFFCSPSNTFLVKRFTDDPTDDGLDNVWKTLNKLKDNMVDVRGKNFDDSTTLDILKSEMKTALEQRRSA